MASPFSRSLAKNVGTSPVSVVSGITGSNVLTVVGILVSNTTTSPITADVYMTASSVDYYIVKGATIPVGGTLIAAGGDHKLNLIAGDVLKVVTSVANGGDAIISTLVTT